MRNNKFKYGISILDYRMRYRRAQSYKLVAQVLIILFMALLRTYGAMPDADVNKLADAIYRIEGGNKTKYPYGIRSVATTNTAQARQICVNTIRNNYSRWLRQNKEKYYLYYLADKYCPISADPIGNKNWRNNIVRIMGQEFNQRYKR